MRRLSNGISGGLLPTVWPLFSGGPLSQDKNSKEGIMNTSKLIIKPANVMILRCSGATLRARFSWGDTHGLKVM